LGRARALHCGLGLLRAWPGLLGGLGVWPAGLAPKPGPLLGYVVKAQARTYPKKDPSPQVIKSTFPNFYNMKIGCLDRQVLDVLGWGSNTE
jgi:hypothetical protein